MALCSPSGGRLHSSGPADEARRRRPACSPRRSPALDARDAGQPSSLPAPWRLTSGRLVSGTARQPWRGGRPRSAAVPSPDAAARPCPRRFNVWRTRRAGMLAFPTSTGRTRPRHGESPNRGPRWPPAAARGDCALVSLEASAHCCALLLSAVHAGGGGGAPQGRRRPSTCVHTARGMRTETDRYFACPSPETGRVVWWRGGRASAKSLADVRGTLGTVTAPTSPWPGCRCSNMVTEKKANMGADRG